MKGPIRTTSKQVKASLAGGPEAPHPRLVFDAIKALHPVVYYIVTLTSTPATKGCANAVSIQAHMLCKVIVLF